MWCEGVSDRVEFIPQDGRRLVAASAELETCSDKCNVSRVSVTVKLTTEHIGKGCDRDTYSLESQRRLCGASMLLLRHRRTYTVNHKKRDILFLTINLANLNRFL